MRRILVFDVNETLLDVRGMRPPFASVMGDASLAACWFRVLLRKMLVTTITGPYVDFAALGTAALGQVADAHDRSLSPAEQATILDAVRQLPPHEDVLPALEQLRDAGFRCVAFSNGTPDVLAHQLDFAGLTSFFEHIASADASRRLKPAPEAYHHLANDLGVSTARLRMVAAHAWDVTGAQRAGCAAAFVARPGKRLSAVDPHPDVIGGSLQEVADRLIALPDSLDRA